MIVQTPGVYIKEKNLLPNSVAPVSTAVPAFIAFTERFPIDPASGKREIKRISNMFEYEDHFGGAFNCSYEVNLSTDALLADKRFFLHDSLSLYFKNGGGPCYIIAAGSYQSITNPTDANTALMKQLVELDLLDEVTVALMPDVHIQFNVAGDQVGITPSEYGTLCSQLIQKCASLKDKFAIIDYHQPLTTTAATRSLISPVSSDIKYGAVYYPWLINSSGTNITTNQLSIIGGTVTPLKTTLVSVNDDLNILSASYGQLYTVASLQNEYSSLITDVSTKTNLTAVFSFLNKLVALLDSGTTLTDSVIENYRTNLSSNTQFTDNAKKLFWFTETVKAGGLFLASPNIPSPNDSWITNSYTNYATMADLNLDSSQLNFTINTGANAAATNANVIADLNAGLLVDLQSIFLGIAGLFDTATVRKAMVENQLFTTDSDYIAANELVQNYMKQLPTQGAIAGIYCKNDRDRGVWKSPANIAVQGIEKPMVEVSNSQQDTLNVDTNTGKSINVIRSFTGKGPLVWGARTLAGNSNEWRYISVRRFFSYTEESILKAMNSFVFEPNNARTWIKIKAMVTSFLVDQWKAGALVGASIEEAFFVRIGEDTTSESEILEGKINVQIGMAVARPAEFIILEFSHFTNE